MPSPSRLQNPSCLPTEPDPAVVGSAVEELRAEIDAASTPAAEATLLHEVGVLEEQLGDDAGAAQDQLGAVNTEPEFREPLERLIAIVERWESRKNLGKLLERLSHVAETATEMTRAEVDRAAFLMDQDDNLDGARDLLQAAAERSPDDIGVWLSLEHLSARAGDDELGLRALSMRSEKARDPTWAGLLTVDLARRKATLGDQQGALETLKLASMSGGRAIFSALFAREALAREMDDLGDQAQALTEVGDLIHRALEDDSIGESSGVPEKSRNAAHAVDAWLRASELQRSLGEPQKASELLERAARALPSEPLLVKARVALAEAQGDRDALRTLVQDEIERGRPEGESGAALYLKLAELKLEENQPEDALLAVRAALELFPTSVPALAIKLDLLAAGADGREFAALLGQISELFESDPARAELCLAGALLSVRHNKNGGAGGALDAARGLLSRARTLGVDSALSLRVTRLVSAVAGDRDGYQAATRELGRLEPAEDDVASLGFELARAALLARDPARAREALSALGNAADGAFLGPAAIAYAVPLLPARPSDDGSAPPVSFPALAALANLETDPDMGRLLHLVTARRALREGDTEAAIEQLGLLCGTDPGDLVSVGALAMLESAKQRPARAAELLEQAAQVLDQPDLGHALRFGAGLLYWQDNQSDEAVRALTRAAELCPDPGHLLLDWALRAAQPDDPSARRRALSALVATEPLSAALERFSLEVGRGGTPEAAEQALKDLRTQSGAASDSPLTLAGELGRALFGAGSDDWDRRQAFEILASAHPDAARLIRAAAHRTELGAPGNVEAPDAERTLDSAKIWAAADPGIAPTLEWLSMAMLAGRPDEERAARRALIERTTGETQAALRAGAALTDHLSGAGQEVPLEGSHPTTRLANLELAPPGSDPEARARALREAGPALGEDSIGPAMALAGFNDLRAGLLGQAMATFRSVVALYPEEIIGWEGLRATAIAAKDLETLAEASAALGDAVADPALGARLWEEAATLLFDELGDETRGEFALNRAVERDVGRFSAFDRLFRRARSKKNSEKVLELATRRLSVAEEPAEIVKLLWERARVLRELGDREGALVALDKVRDLEPDHLGVLALTGEIHIALGHFEQAADSLGQLARHPEAPGPQRLMSGIAAADLYENRLERLDQALEMLKTLHREGLGNLRLRERLARAAAKQGDWSEAIAVLEQLMLERDSTEGRAEAARLSMTIYRDELGDPAGAYDAVAQLLTEAPDDAEALDLVLTGVFGPEASRALLGPGCQALMEHLSGEPFDPERLTRAARVARALDRPQLLQAVLGARVALGADPHEIDPELFDLDRRVAHVPHIAIDDQALPDLADPGDRGPVAELFRALSTTITAALGPSLSALSVGRRERVDARAGLPLRNEIAAWAGALGIDDFELYVGGPDPAGITAVASDTPALVVGSQVSAPLSPANRQAVARELFAVRRGTTVLRHRDPEDVHAILAAACHLAEVPIDSPPFALLGEFQRQLGREIPRKVRRALPELARALADSGQDVREACRAATSTLDRMAAVAAGDVSWVLSGGQASRGEVPRTREAQARFGRLLSFVLSPAYLELREKLGMGVR